jgi:hypothetical protein
LKERFVEIRSTVGKEEIDKQVNQHRKKIRGTGENKAMSKECLTYRSLTGIQI